MNSRLFIEIPRPDVLKPTVGNFRRRSKRSDDVRDGSKAENL
jgi:hypothetical protein